MISAILLLTAIAFIIGVVLTALMSRLAAPIGLVDRPGAAGHHKPEIRPIPTVGGIGIFWAVVIPVLAGILLARGETLDRFFPALAEHRPGIIAESPTAFWLLAAMAALHALGLADDRLSLGPWTKLMVQIALAATLAYLTETRLLTLLDGVLPLAPWPSIVITALWFVVVTNALNFIDNMDGLAGGVAAISATLFLTAALINGQWFVAAMLAVLVGALIAFLCYNFPPATVFMGDAGSTVVGFLLAFLTVRTTYLGGDDAAWYAVFMPLVILAVPLYDFATVVWLRLSQGRNPMVGDQQHFSHRLVQRGLSRRDAVLVIYGLTAATGIGGIILAGVSGWQAMLIGVQTVVLLLVMALYEFALRNPAETR